MADGNRRPGTDHWLVTPLSVLIGFAPASVAEAAGANLVVALVAGLVTVVIAHLALGCLVFAWYERHPRDS